MGDDETQQERLRFTFACFDGMISLMIHQSEMPLCDLDAPSMDIYSSQPICTVWDVYQLVYGFLYTVYLIPYLGTLHRPMELFGVAGLQVRAR